jgi:hypothetical protein
MREVLRAIGFVLLIGPPTALCFVPGTESQTMQEGAAVAAFLVSVVGFAMIIED